MPKRDGEADLDVQWMAFYWGYLAGLLVGLSVMGFLWWLA